MADKKRTYQTTHPWINFTLDLRGSGLRLWTVLGEAASKIEHLSRVPIKPALSQELHLVYLAKGVAATTAIEGNTLTEAQVRKRIEGQLQLPLSQNYLQREIDNVLAAVEHVANQVLSEPQDGITPFEIQTYNGMILKDLPVEKGVAPGELRNYEVSVGPYSGAPARDCEHLLDRLCVWLREIHLGSEAVSPTILAIIKAVLAHLYLAWIHPFGDGNGRTARLLEFRILLAAGVPTPACHLLSNHYNQTRAEYYRQLNYASQSGGNVIPFLTYATQGLVDQLREQLDLIWVQQWDLAWRDLVHELLPDSEGEAAKRKRHLALDLAPLDAPHPIEKASDISVRLAKDYAVLSERTLRRDIHELEKLGLVIVKEGTIFADRSILNAFMPARANTG